MPWRSFTREQGWLFPPTLDDLMPSDHPARFVAAFVDELPASCWETLGVDLAGEAIGAPAYHPRALLGVWLYGFMTGLRSSRKLEAACRDQVPYLWLTGWQHPDHNTLWRFYQAHRPHLRYLLRETVQTAVRLALLDWAVQAVDGTKVGGNAARERTLDAQGLRRLLERTETAIADLEAQNEGGDDPPPPQLPDALQRATNLRDRVRAALQQSEQERRTVNLTDPEAHFMPGRQGFVVGYNAQVMVAPVTGTTQVLITAAAVVQQPTDNAQLLPLMEQAAELTGKPAGMTLADAGYFSGPNLAACAARGQAVAIPEKQPHPAHPYHKDRFHYDPGKDEYACPEGQPLHFGHVKHRTAEAPVRVYRTPRGVCHTCPAFGICTKDAVAGRLLEVTPADGALRAHRAWMATPTAQAVLRPRKQLVEPVFGILKEQRHVRRFLLRGLNNVRAEWELLAAAFNLRSLWSAMRRSLAGPPPISAN